MGKKFWIAVVLLVLFNWFSVADVMDVTYILVNFTKLTLLELAVILPIVFFPKNWTTLFLVSLGVEVLIIPGLALCSGGIDLGIDCDAGIFSDMLGVSLLVRDFGGVFVLPFLFGLSIFFISRGYFQYKKEKLTDENPRFWQQDLVVVSLMFLLLQIPLFFLARYAVEIREELLDHHKEIRDLEQQLRHNVITSVNFLVGSPPVSTLGGQEGQWGVIGWINQVESRFSEYDLANNILVLNDVIEHFYKKYGYLPLNSAEITNLVPSLKPRYKTDGDRSNGVGWIYKVLYQRRSDQEYDLCVVSDVPLGEDLVQRGQWRQEHDGVYCLQIHQIKI